MPLLVGWLTLPAHIYGLLRNANEVPLLARVIGAGILVYFAIAALVKAKSLKRGHYENEKRFTLLIIVLTLLLWWKKDHQLVFTTILAVTASFFSLLGQQGFNHGVPPNFALFVVPAPLALLDGWETASGWIITLLLLVLYLLEYAWSIDNFYSAPPQDVAETIEAATKETVEYVKAGAEGFAVILQNPIFWSGDYNYGGRNTYAPKTARQNVITKSDRNLQLKRTDKKDKAEINVSSGSNTQMKNKFSNGSRSSTTYG